MIKEKIENLENEVREVLGKSRSPVLLNSFGKDSLFLLSIIRKINYNVANLSFNWWWNNHQKVFVKQVIKEWDLKVFFYRPTRIVFEKEHIISFYQVGNKEIPVIADVLPSGHCGLKVAQKAVSIPVIPPYLWDVTLTGTKQSDAHPLVDKGYDIKDLSSETTQIVTPLWEWTDKEVLEAVKLTGTPIDNRFYQDGDGCAETGAVNHCFNCISAPEGQVFCPQTNGLISVLSR